MLNQMLNSFIPQPVLSCWAGCGCEGGAVLRGVFVRGGVFGREVVGRGGGLERDEMGMEGEREGVGMG